MRAVHDHADGVHLPDQRPAVAGQPLVDLVEAARPGGVAQVVRRQHRAHAEVEELPDEPKVPVERAGVLQVERDRDPALAAHPVDVVDGVAERQVVLTWPPPARNAASSLRTSSALCGA